MRKRMFSLLLALGLTLGLAAPAMAAESASTIRLSKTAGTVAVSKSSEKPLTLMSNMRLYNGYHVTTKAESYAWMNLDDTKLIKEDAASEVEVRKDGKKLEVNILSGNVFFDVSEKLEDDESLNISTSTMIVGIRGTAGYVRMIDRWSFLLTVLDGVVQCSVTDPVTGQLKSEPVRAGETVICVVYSKDHAGDKCDILRDTWTVDDIPGFVLYDVVRDLDLCDRIKADSGTDVLEELAAIVGGDPSGRTEDGSSASPEILGEADRRLASDEEDFEERQDAVDAALKQQHSGDSSDKVFDQKTSQPSSGGTSFSDEGSSSGGGSSGEDSGSSTLTGITAAMPVTTAELQTLLGQYNQVTVRPNADPAQNTLDVSGLTVPTGKTLTVQDGIQTTVPSGASLRVDGTLTGQNLTNNGSVTVTSSDTLRLSGSLSGSGRLTVTATGHVVTEGSCAWGSASFTEGAQVQSRGGFGGSLPSGWTVSAADSDGYYSLEYTGVVTPPPPVTYTITFDDNMTTLLAPRDVTAVEDTPPVTISSTTMTTGADGTLSSLPTAYTEALIDDTAYVLEGWYTSPDGPDGGTKITTSTVFNSNATVYAHWVEGNLVFFYDSYVSSNYVVQYAPLGQPIPQPAAPTRAGYEFSGWARDDVLETGKGVYFDLSEPAAYNKGESFSCSGIWGPYTITFHVNSAPGTKEISSKSYETNIFGWLETGPEDPILDETSEEYRDWSFIGWSPTGFDGDPDMDTIDISYGYMFGSNIDLYSTWGQQL